MSVVVLGFEKMPVAIMGPYDLYFWGHIFLGLKQGVSLLHGRVGPAPNMHLKGEGESSPFPCLPGILHWNFPPFWRESWLLPTCFI